MRILLLNAPHPAIGSRIPDEHLPPLGLLCIGGPLLDAGHQVTLLDAEFGPLSEDEILQQVHAARPELILLGHSGSTSAHPVIAALARQLRAELPEARIVYGGVFPSYHYRDILRAEPQFDLIVRGEGEQTVLTLVEALGAGRDLATVCGIAYREGDRVCATAAAPMIEDLDRYRVGWELVDLARYSYYGGRRAVVIQFSRGCPHPCSYCGQSGFWSRWRHRSPARLAQEIAWLHRSHGVELFNLADENPTVSRRHWRALCEAIIAEGLEITLIGSTRADDIVRDADLLPLYRRAGVERFLLGMEHTDPVTLAQIRKGSTTQNDREAIRLLREHGILSLATWVTDFAEVRDRDFYQVLRQLLCYDPDQIMSLYATPHRWTGYYRSVQERRVIQPDVRLWDYKHQVLESVHMPPWRIFLWVKCIEALLQLRPKALWRALLQPDRACRRGMFWFTRMGRRVFMHECRAFFFRDRRCRPEQTVRQFWGEPQDAEARVLRLLPRSPVERGGPRQTRDSVPVCGAKETAAP